jgi:CheY-like chemotaxis protein
MLHTIFDPFTQGKQTLERSEGGLGLGLALVKGLVALHGGEVDAASGGAGRGTDFVVKLPLVSGHRGAAAQRGDVATERPTVPHRRVLVVDDNKDAAETLAQLVEMLGHEADVAYDGPSAVAKARVHAPDVILCDIGLPGIDGYEVARQLRDGGGADVRLVAVSGYAQPDDVRGRSRQASMPTCRSRRISTGSARLLAEPRDDAATSRAARPRTHTHQR